MRDLGNHRQVRLNSTCRDHREKYPLGTYFLVNPQGKSVLKLLYVVLILGYLIMKLICS